MNVFLFQCLPHKCSISAFCYNPYPLGLGIKHRFKILKLATAWNTWLYQNHGEIVGSLCAGLGSRQLSHSIMWSPESPKGYWSSAWQRQPAGNLVSSGPGAFSLTVLPGRLFPKTVTGFAPSFHLDTCSDVILSENSYPWPNSLYRVASTLLLGSSTTCPLLSISPWRSLPLICNYVFIVHFSH